MINSICYPLRFPRSQEPYGARATVPKEQPNAQLIFQLPELAAQSRLGNTDDCAGRNDARSSAAVVRLQIVGDHLGISFADRRAERPDHLGDLGVPQSRVWKRRIHHDVIETVATGAVAFDLVETRRL